MSYTNPFGFSPQEHDSLADPNYWWNSPEVPGSKNPTSRKDDPCSPADWTEKGSEHFYEDGSRSQGSENGGSSSALNKRGKDAIPPKIQTAARFIFNTTSANLSTDQSMREQQEHAHQNMFTSRKEGLKKEPLTTTQLQQIADHNPGALHPERAAEFYNIFSNHVAGFFSSKQNQLNQTIEGSRAQSKRGAPKKISNFKQININRAETALTIIPPSAKVARPLPSLPDQDKGFEPPLTKQPKFEDSNSPRLPLGDMGESNPTPSISLVPLAGAQNPALSANPQNQALAALLKSPEATTLLQNMNDSFLLFSKFSPILQCWTKYCLTNYRLYWVASLKAGLENWGKHSMLAQYKAPERLAFEILITMLEQNLKNTKTELIQEQKSLGVLASESTNSAVWHRTYNYLGDLWLSSLQKMPQKGCNSRRPPHCLRLLRDDVLASADTEAKIDTFCSIAKLWLDTTNTLSSLDVPGDPVSLLDHPILFHDAGPDILLAPLAIMACEWMIYHRGPTFVSTDPIKQHYSSRSSGILPQDWSIPQAWPDNYKATANSIEKFAKMVDDPPLSSLKDNCWSNLWRSLLNKRSGPATIF